MKLYLIPSPLADDAGADHLPQELKEVLRHCHHFLVENVRSARRYISSLALGLRIDDLSFEVLDKDSNYAAVKKYMMELKAKGCPSLGVISEAGCPGIADPGALAVQAAHTLGIPVKPLVGPSSIFLALMGSGFSGQRFRFHGYLPIDAAALKKRLLQLSAEAMQDQETQIFMETPYRNRAILEQLIQLLPTQQGLCIACQLSSPEEFIATKSLGEWKKSLPDLHKKPCIFLLGGPR